VRSNAHQAVRQPAAAEVAHAGQNSRRNPYSFGAVGSIGLAAFGSISRFVRGTPR
jgi:hypothetical protein